MTLADSIKKHAKFSHPSYQCTFATVFESLNKEDQKELLEHIKKGTPSSTLVLALRAEGHRIGEATFNNHRNGRCRCIVN
jgi:hypothetical protein